MGECSVLLAAFPLVDGILDERSYLGIGDVAHRVKDLPVYVDAQTSGQAGGQTNVTPGQVWLGLEPLLHQFVNFVHQVKRVQQIT